MSDRTSQPPLPSPPAALAAKVLPLVSQPIHLSPSSTTSASAKTTSEQKQQQHVYTSVPKEKSSTAAAPAGPGPALVPPTSTSATSIPQPMLVRPTSQRTISIFSTPPTFDHFQQPVTSSVAAAALLAASSSTPPAALDRTLLRPITSPPRTAQQASKPQSSTPSKTPMRSQSAARQRQPPCQDSAAPASAAQAISQPTPQLTPAQHVFRPPTPPQAAPTGPITIDWRVIFDSARISDEHLLDFGRRATCLQRVTIEWYDPTAPPASFISSRRPSTFIWNGTFVGMRPDEDGEERLAICFDHQQGSVTLLPAPNYCVILLHQIFDSIPTAREIEARIPPYDFASRNILATPQVVIHFDGGNLMGPKRESSSSACAKIYLHGQEQPNIIKFSRYFLEGTNNIAEHLGLQGALRLARLFHEGHFSEIGPVLNVAIIGDAKVVCRQVTGNATCTTPWLINYKRWNEDELLKQNGMQGWTTILYRVEREHNELADSECIRALKERTTVDPLNLFEGEIPIVARADADAEIREERPIPGAAVIGNVETQKLFTISELAYLRTFPTLDHVPLEAAQAWSQVVQGALAQVLYAKTDVQHVEAFSRLLALPSLYLPSHMSVRKLCLMLKERQPALRKPPSIERSETDREARAARDAARFARRGELRKAVKTLQPAKLADVADDSVAAKLKDKFPIVENAFDAHDHPMTHEPEALPAIPPNVVRAVLKNMSPVAGSGLDRWNSALLLAAIDSDHHNDCLTLLCGLLGKMLRNPATFCGILSHSRGVALEKDDQDVRPVGIASFFRKLLASVCHRLDDPAKLLPQWQQGMASSGCYKVIRDVRAAYENGDSVLTIDAVNAFNSVKRKAVWNYLQRNKRRLPFIRAYFVLTYACMSTVHFQHSGNDWLRIETNVGVTQGDPASGFLFDATYCEALGAVVASLPLLYRIHGIHDDVTITGPQPEQLVRLLRQSEQVLENVGLKVKREKCELLLPPATHENGVLDYTKANMLETPICKLVDGLLASIRIVGGHIGCDDAVRAFITKKCSETCQLINTIAQVLKTEPRCAIAMLRFCAQPKLLYRFSCHQPWLTRESAIAYDAEIMRAMTILLDGTPKHEVVTSSFGFGFIDYPAALDILYARFLADTAPRQGPRSSFRRRNELSEANLLVELQAQRDSIVLQSFPQLKARLGSSGAAATTSFSWMSPFAPVGIQADYADVLHMLRVQALIEPQSPAPCHCGATDDGSHTFAGHLLTCSALRGATRVYRHNLVLAALHNSLQRFGVMTVIEPRFYEYDDGKANRPDLTVFKDSVPVATDLVISADPASAIKQKLDKHGAAVQHRGHYFKPIAMCIWGSFHPSVYTFLRSALASLPPALKKLAILQTQRVMSEAWLIGTVAMLHGTVKDSTRRLLNLDETTSNPRLYAVEHLFASA